MELVKLGNDVSVSVASTEGKHYPLVITAYTPVDLTYEGNFDVKAKLREQTLVLEKRTNALVAQQMLAWHTAKAKDGMIGNQKNGDQQVLLSDFGNETQFSINVDAKTKNIVVSLWLPVGIITYGDRPTDLVADQFKVLRQRIARELRTAVVNYEGEVNLRAAAASASDLGLDAEIVLEEDLLVEVEIDDNTLGRPVCIPQFDN